MYVFILWPEKSTGLSSCSFRPYYGRLIVKVDRVDRQNTQVDRNRRLGQLRGLLSLRLADVVAETGGSAPPPPTTEDPTSERRTLLSLHL